MGTKTLNVRSKLGTRREIQPNVAALFYSDGGFVITWTGLGYRLDLTIGELDIVRRERRARGDDADRVPKAECPLTEGAARGLQIAA